MAHPSAMIPIMRLMLGASALALLVACDGPVDLDLRNDLGTGFDTSEAVRNMPSRPRPDSRGVITYPNYQVVVAQQGDTIRSIAQRLGANADELARFNGIAPDSTLRRDEVIALPRPIAAGTPAAAPATTAPRDITAVATTALDRAGPQQPVATAPLPPASAAPAPAPAPAAPVQAGTEPIRHKVARGETVFIISRLYNVPTRAIAEWNGLGPDLLIREGQFLLIPQGGAAPPAPAPVTVEQPGTGSSTPVPPSATAPLPDEAPVRAAEATPEPAPAPAPDIGQTAAQPAASNARLAYPVQGAIIRAYAPGRNEGIDIGVAAGTEVKATDAGTVAAVTTDTAGVAIVVIKHADNLLTVYTNIEGLTVAKGASVSRGQTIGRVRAGDPSFVHFEVRRGLQAVDPADFLP